MTAATYCSDCGVVFDDGMTNDDDGNFEIYAGAALKTFDVVDAAESADRCDGVTSKDCSSCSKAACKVGTNDNGADNGDGNGVINSEGDSCWDTLDDDSIVVFEGTFVDIMTSSRSGCGAVLDSGMSANGGSDG